MTQPQTSRFDPKPPRQGAGGADVKKSRPNRTLARRIAKWLFTDGTGVKANHLKLYHNEKYMGGWCELACADQIERIIDIEQKKVQP